MKRIHSSDKINASDYFLDEPKTFRYKKKNTYQNFIESMDDMPLAKKVYEICLHFSAEEYALTLTYGEIEKVTDETSVSMVENTIKKPKDTQRRIRLEDGWVT